MESIDGSLKGRKVTMETAMNERIVGYWCTECEKKDEQTFFFKKEGYCRCANRGYFHEKLGETFEGIAWGFKEKDLKKIRKNWVPVYIKEK